MVVEDWDLLERKTSGALGQRCKQKEELVGLAEKESSVTMMLASMLVHVHQNSKQKVSKLIRISWNYSTIGCSEHVSIHVRSSVDTRNAAASYSRRSNYNSQEPSDIMGQIAFISAR